MSKKINYSNICVSSILFVLIVSFSYIFSVIHDNFDMDLIWHLKIGKDILENKAICLDNTYSWLSNTVWTQQEWLFDVILYVVTSVGGLFTFGFIHFATQFIFIYCSVYRNNNMRFKLLIVFAALLFYILFPFTSLNRPVEYSSLLLPLFLYLYDKEFKQKPILYFAVGVFIANFHCGAAVTIIALMILVFVVDILVTKLFECFSEKYSDNMTKSFAINYIWSVLLFVFGLCFNPYGPQHIVNMFSVMDLSSTNQIREWQPFQSGSYITWIFLFLIAYSFGYAFRRKVMLKKRKDIRIIFVLSAFLVLSCVSSKGFVMFYYLWLSYGATYLSDMIYDAGVWVGFRREWFSEKLEYDFLNPLHIAHHVPNLILVTSVLFATLSFTADKGSMYKFVLSGCEQYIDKEVGDYLQDHISPDNKILHGYLTGNCLLAYDIPVFIDTRQQPYCAEFEWSSALDDYFNAQPYNAMQMDSFVKKYSFDYAISNVEYPINWYLSQSEEWKVAFTNESRSILVWKRLE